MSSHRRGIVVGEGLRADGILVLAPRPLGELWIPLNEGLTVLYGRNGVGKTTVLRAIAGAMRGISTPNWRLSVHLSPVDEFEGYDERLLRYLCIEDGPLDEADESRQPDAGVADGDDDNQEVEPQDLVVRLRSTLREAADKFGFAEGLCHTPRVVLTAVGSTETPGWSVGVSVVPTSAELFAEQLMFPASGWNNVRLRKRQHADGECSPTTFQTLVTADGWQSDPLPVEVQTLSFNGYDEELDGLPAQGLIACLVGSERMDVNGATVDFLRSSVDTEPEEMGSLISEVTASTMEPGELVGVLLDVLSANATLAMQTFTHGKGTLQAQLCHPNRWLDGEVVEWIGTDLEGTPLPVDALGYGSQRWAHLAISFALTSPDPRQFMPTIFMIDEPERALHSAAQLDVANAFAATLAAGELGMVHVPAAIVATHSAAFLSLPGANLIHVVRDSAKTIALEAIDTTIGVEGLTAQLGISRPDVLLTTRCFMFVEGDHDEAILRTVFGDTLRDRHVQLGVMNGASNVTAYITAQHLLTYSDARIRVVLDALGSAVTERWSLASAAFTDGDAAAARRHLEKVHQIGNREAKWLYEAGIAALERNQLDRVEVVGLALPDIMNYLPVQEFVPTATDWPTLFKESGSMGREGKFKDWLRKSKGAHFNASTLADIAATLTDLGDLPSAVAGI